jgi:hypothetical protein
MPPLPDFQGGEIPIHRDGVGYIFLPTLHIKFYLLTIPSELVKFYNYKVTH